MREKLFNVIFTGRFSPGLSQHQVRTNLARMIGFSDREMNRLLSPSAIVRSGVDRKAAWRCWEHFRRAGALCSVEPMKQLASERRVDNKVAGIPSEGNVCPCCSALLKYSTICSSCGVDIPIYRLALHPDT